MADFYKFSRETASDDEEALHVVDQSLASYSLRKGHVTELVTEDKLESLCYQRVGSENWIREEASNALSVPASVLPGEVVNAWQMPHSLSASRGRQLRPAAASGSSVRRLCRLVPGCQPLHPLHPIFLEVTI